MNNLNSLQEIARAIRNLIRTGIVTDVDLDEGLCRVQTAWNANHLVKLAHLSSHCLRVVGSLGR